MKTATQGKGHDLSKAAERTQRMDARASLKATRALLKHARAAKRDALALARDQIRAARKALPVKIAHWREVNRQIMRRAVEGERHATQAQRVELRTGTRGRAAQLIDAANAEIDRDLKHLRWLGHRRHKPTSSARVAAALRTAEKRSEADDFVKAELPEEFWAAWEETKHKIKPKKHTPRWEVALEYFQEHSEVVSEANARKMDRGIARELRGEEQAWLDANEGTPEARAYLAQRDKAQGVEGYTARHLRKTPQAKAFSPTSASYERAKRNSNRGTGAAPKRAAQIAKAPKPKTRNPATVSDEHMQDMIDLLDPRDYGYQAGETWIAALRTYPGKYARELVKVRAQLRRDRRATERNQKKDAARTAREARVAARPPKPKPKTRIAEPPTSAERAQRDLRARALAGLLGLTMSTALSVEGLIRFGDVASLKRVRSRELANDAENLDRNLARWQPIMDEAEAIAKAAGLEEPKPKPKPKGKRETVPASVVAARAKYKASGSTAEADQNARDKAIAAAIAVLKVPKSQRVEIEQLVGSGMVDELVETLNDYFSAPSYAPTSDEVFKAQSAAWDKLVRWAKYFEALPPSAR